MAHGEDYETFVNKFEPKRTTDDCYTPPVVYDAVADWVANEYGLDRENFVRPFYPGGDFENYGYLPTDVVVDNPPFSIFKNIVSFYCDHGIGFFLFAPGMSPFSPTYVGRCAVITTGATVTYENKASVNTSFVTNLEPRDIVARTAPGLHDAVKKAVAIFEKKQRKEIAKYSYPAEVCSAAMMNYLSKHHVDFALHANDVRYVEALDYQRKANKSIFGGGYILSEKAAAEKAAAEKAAAEKAEAHVWELSEREREIIRSLGEGS